MPTTTTSTSTMIVITFVSLLVLSKKQANIIPKPSLLQGEYATSEVSARERSFLM